MTNTGHIKAGRKIVGWKKNITRPIEALILILHLILLLNQFQIDLKTSKEVKYQ